MPGQEQASSKVAPPYTWKTILSFGIAALACPCHLPILFGLLVGTTLGGWMVQYTPVVTLAMIWLCVIALLYGVRRLSRWQTTSPTRRETKRGDMRVKSG